MGALEEAERAEEGLAVGSVVMAADTPSIGPVRRGFRDFRGDAQRSDRLASGL
jgi:hypothetical protein